MIVHEQLCAVRVTAVVEEGHAGGEGRPDAVPTEEVVSHILFEVRLGKGLSLNQSGIIV